MEITEPADVADDIVSGWLRMGEEAHPHRTTNRPHVSDIIPSIVSNNPGIDRGENSEIKPEQTRIMWMMGLLWERAMQEQEGWAHYGVVKDDVEGNPDMFNPLTGLVTETKLTWRSLHTSRPQDRFYYMTQLMSYCHMVGTDKGRLLVCYVNGDYRPTLPKVIAVDFVFTERDLMENWAMMMNHLEYMKEHGETPWLSNK